LMLKARQAKMRHNIDMIVIDYLQLMHGRTRGDDNRVQEVSSISRAMKGLARELRVPVLAISQLSRAPEQRPDKRPILSDLRESGCLAGDTPVYLPDSGSYMPIKDLVGRSDFRVLALDKGWWRMDCKRVTNVFATGTKPVFKLTTQLGHSVRATANHKFLTMEGWRRLDELKVGDHIATPRILQGSDQDTMSRAEIGFAWAPDRRWLHFDVIPAIAWRMHAIPAMTRASQSQLRARPAVVESDQLELLATSDVYWDKIRTISPDGIEDVYDLTVDDLHNFVAGNVILHNSIEQDADVVMFLFRPDYYKSDEKPGVAEVHVAKHRNGPTGTIELKFRRDHTRFYNLETRRPEPGTE